MLVHEILIYCTPFFNHVANATRLCVCYSVSRNHAKVDGKHRNSAPVQIVAHGEYGVHRFERAIFRAARIYLEISRQLVFVLAWILACFHLFHSLDVGALVVKLEYRSFTRRRICNGSRRQQFGLLQTKYVVRGR